MEAKNKKNPSLPPIITEIYFTIKKNRQYRKPIKDGNPIEKMYFRWLKGKKIKKIPL